jgi:hypothetical protein
MRRVCPLRLGNAFITEIGLTFLKKDSRRSQFHTAVRDSDLHLAAHYTAHSEQLLEWLNPNTMFRTVP